MQIAIRCHPFAPVATGEVEEWLERQTERLREAAPQSACRLLRLSQAAPPGAREAGWLIELDAGAGDGIDPERLEGVLSDMRLLGLRPTILRGAAVGGAASGATS